MELLLQGNFLGLIKAEVFVAASYTLTFAGSQFYVRVTVDLSGINDVSEITITGVNSVSCIFKTTVLLTESRTDLSMLLKTSITKLSRTIKLTLRDGGYINPMVHVRAHGQKIIRQTILFC